MTRRTGAHAGPLPDPRHEPDAPAHYELRVAERLHESWAPWFSGLALTHGDDGTTILRGFVTDQSALHGVLAKVRDLGLTLISVSPVATAKDADSQQQQHH
jgi:hypothetical protein